MKHQPALLTMWDGSLDRSQSDLEWDTILMPLLFGSVYILDNMIVDNPAFMRSLSKPWYQNLLRTYSDFGLIKILHRKYYRRSDKVSSADDLAMIWLSRTSEKEIRTVGFHSFSDEGNADFRKALAGLSRTGRKKRLKLLSDIYKREVDENIDCVRQLRLLDELFFSSTQMGSKTTSFEFGQKILPTLQERVLMGAGVSNPRELLTEAARGKQHLVDAVRNSNFGDSQMLYGHDWGEFRENIGKDDSFCNFIEMMVKQGDGGLIESTQIDLATAAKSVSGQINAPLSLLVNATFRCGIPELVGCDVLWPSNNEPMKAGASLGKPTVSGNDSEREEIANAIQKVMKSEPLREELLAFSRRFGFVNRESAKELSSIVFPANTKAVVQEVAMDLAVGGINAGIWSILRSQETFLGYVIQGAQVVTGTALGLFITRTLNRLCTGGFRAPSSIYRKSVQLIEAVERLNRNNVETSPLVLDLDRVS